jgi:hypothetical protein
VRWFFHYCAWSGAPCAHTEAASHQVVDEQLQGARDDGAEVAAGMGVAQQVARLLELLFEYGIGRELDAVTLCGERLDDIARARGVCELFGDER